MWKRVTAESCSWWNFRALNSARAESKSIFRNENVCHSRDGWSTWSILRIHLLLNVLMNVLQWWSVSASTHVSAMKWKRTRQKIAALAFTYGHSAGALDQWPVWQNKCEKENSIKVRLRLCDAFLVVPLCKPWCGLAARDLTQLDAKVARFAVKRVCGMNVGHSNPRIKVIAEPVLWCMTAKTGDGSSRFVYSHLPRGLPWVQRRDVFKWYVLPTWTPVTFSATSISIKCWPTKRWHGNLFFFCRKHFPIYRRWVERQSGSI